MGQKLAIIFIFSLILIPIVSSYCAPGAIYCDNANQNILKCDDEGNQQIVYQECEKGCEMFSGEPICKENLMQVKPLSNFILPIGIILIIVITVVVFIKVLKSKRKTKSKIQ